MVLAGMPRHEQVQELVQVALQLSGHLHVGGQFGGWGAFVTATEGGHGRCGPRRVSPPTIGGGRTLLGGRFVSSPWTVVVL